MKEIELFETWLNSLTEATVLPTSTDKQQELIKVLSEPLPVGADATNATETMGNLFIDPEMIDDLKDLAQTDPNADARPVVMSRMSAYKSQPGIAALMAKISNSTAQGEQPAAPGPGDEAVDTAVAPPAPAEAPAAEQPAEQPVADEIAPEQPVAEDSEYEDDLASILKHAGISDSKRSAPNYVVGSLEEGHGPFDEGAIGSTIGGALGHALMPSHGPMASAAGAAAGSWLTDKLAQSDIGRKATRTAAIGANKLARKVGGRHAGKLAHNTVHRLMGPADAEANRHLIHHAERRVSDIENFEKQAGRAGLIGMMLSGDATIGEILAHPSAPGVARELLARGGRLIDNEKLRNRLKRIVTLGHAREMEEGVIGSTVGGALGSSLGPAGTLAGAAVGDWAGEKLAGTEWGKKATKWASDKAGQAATAIGGKGAGEIARGATSYMLSPDSDTNVNARLATGATGAALSAAGHIPGMAGKIAKGANLAYNLYNKGSRALAGTDALEKAVGAGATAYELMQQPGAVEMAKQILSKGTDAIKDPRVRDTLLKVAGQGMNAMAAHKSELGGFRGAIKKGVNAVKGAADKIGGTGSVVPAMASHSTAPAPTPPAQRAKTAPVPQAPTGGTTSGTSWTSGSSIAPTAHFGSGAGSVLKTSAKKPVHESVEIARWKNLAGIRTDDN